MKIEFLKAEEAEGWEKLMGGRGWGWGWWGVREAESQRREGGMGLKRLFGGGGIKPDLQRCID